MVRHNTSLPFANIYCPRMSVHVAEQAVVADQKVNMHDARQPAPAVPRPARFQPPARGVPRFTTSPEMAARRAAALLDRLRALALLALCGICGGGRRRALLPVAAGRASPRRISAGTRL